MSKCIEPRRQGRWINSGEKDGLGYPIYKCSECGEQSIHDHGLRIGPYLTHFCPECGAEMPDWYDDSIGVDYECCMVYKANVKEWIEAACHNDKGERNGRT